MEPATPANRSQRWARVLPNHERDYPTSYSGQWFRILQRQDPDVPASGDYVWLDLAGGARQVAAQHFEIAERNRRRILVVDDDPGILRTLQIALSNLGYEVFLARDGEEAIGLWQRSAPDLIVTDIHMPRKSGLLFLQEIRENLSGTPIIIMTDGGPAVDFKLFGLAGLLGASRTMPKPFTLEAMMSAVNQELSR
jgi:CheY-like chemotaxis protein